MDRYGDVKVGDEFFYVEHVGVNKWREVRFSKKFFISCLVIKVTRTQFVTDKGRYRKGGGGAIGSCPAIYKQDLLPIENARLVNLSRFDIADLRNIETAKEAASLIMQLDALIKESNK